MTVEQFKENLFNGINELKENRKYAVQIYVETREQADVLDDFLFGEDNKNPNPNEVEDSKFIIKFHDDEHEIGIVWLYKYSSIGLLIDSIYGVPYTEHMILKKMLLGDSIEEIENFYCSDDDINEEAKLCMYGDNYYKPIHPWHCNVNKVKFYLQGSKEQKPYRDAKYWESERDTSYD